MFAAWLENGQNHQFRIGEPVLPCFRASCFRGRGPRSRSRQMPVRFATSSSVRLFWLDLMRAIGEPFLSW